ncbi:MAG TPA: lysylphosphatidylglycerol synthase domain-containing protein [Dermatophilaceae bacterium]|nr:lysylphosphatidylglycerol synthase domain-containing protein [Dermatophilaceae bacterium]
MALQILLGTGLGATILIWGLPALTHASWEEIGGLLSQLPIQTFLVGLALMFSGLYCYTFTMAASLPGLRHAPALIVNLCGSGIANVLPLGAALAAATQYGILRSWGFKHRNIGTSLIVTSIWNMLIRLMLPLVAVAWLISDTDLKLPENVVTGTLIGGIAAALLAVAWAAVLLSPRAAHSVGRTLNGVAGPILKMLRRDRGQNIEALASDLRARIIGVVRGSWLGLTVGVVGFLGLYAYLYGFCMQAFGIQMSWARMFACYAFSRLLTMVPLTPGGIGTTEVGPAGLMVFFGADGVSAAASVFLFAVYSHLLEIVFGAVFAGVWALTRTRYYRLQHEDGDEDPDEDPVWGVDRPGSSATNPPPVTGG